MRTVNVQDAKTHLSRLLREVEAGEVVEIARGGRVIARLVRAEEAQTRQWGIFQGQVRMTADAFDAMSEEESATWDDGPVIP